MVSLSILTSILVPVSDVVTLIVFSEELTLLLSIFSSMLVNSLVTLPIASSTEVPDLISNDVHISTDDVLNIFGTDLASDEEFIKLKGGI